MPELPELPEPGRSGAALGVSSIPTLMAFRDGVLVFAQPGALRSAALKRVISAARGLDMDEVRATLAERNGGSVR